MGRTEEPAPKKDQHDLEVNVTQCGNDKGHCAEVCCWNGDDLKFCCSYAYPICNVPKGVCYKSTAEAEFMAAMVVRAEEPKSQKGQRDLDVNVTQCGNDKGHCAEVCCWNGDDLKFCCSYAYPICNVPKGVCYKSTA